VSVITKLYNRLDQIRNERAPRPKPSISPVMVQKVPAIGSGCNCRAVVGFKQVAGRQRWRCRLAVYLTPHVACGFQFRRVSFGLRAGRSVG
jgi:hypothetical protein